MKNYLKTSLFSFSFFLTMLLETSFASSCSLFNWNTRNQKFVEGNFVGDIYFENKIIKENAASLEIKKISEQEYIDAKSVNVVEDINGGDNPYYLLTTKIFDEAIDDYVAFQFHSIKFVPNEYCIYQDENNNQIYPRYYDGRKQKNGIFYDFDLKLKDTTDFCRISFKKKEID